jgi:hypothetical protein
MSKRTLEEVFSNDPLGLLEVSVVKSSKLSHYAIYYETYEELLCFIEAHKREPYIESKNIHEAKLAARLKKLRSTPEALTALSPFDTNGILESSVIFPNKSALTLEDVLSNGLLQDDDDIFNLEHVKIGTKSQTTSADMAKRNKCMDFDRFRSMFQKIQMDLNDGSLETQAIKGIAEIQTGQAFILSGLIAYVAEVGEKHERRKGHHNARMRIIYSNEMESNLLLRSFGAALYKDRSARAIISNTEGPFFAKLHQGINKTGIVYVLKSKSTAHNIAKHIDYLHKIGLTAGSVNKRIANAKKESTYLLADVEVVAEFTLYNMNLNATEKVLHKFFCEAQAEIEINDRFGNPVRPKEWFFLPLGLIKQAIQKLQDGTLKQYKYNSRTVKFELK